MSGSMRKRRVEGAGSQGGPGVLQLRSDASQGFKIGPTSVLVLSLLFIGFVVVLHIWGKFRRA